MAFPGRVLSSLAACAGGDEVEFMTVITFDSIANVIEFQGDDDGRAYVPDAARAVLSRWDEVCMHFESLGTGR